MANWTRFFFRSFRNEFFFRCLRYNNLFSLFFAVRSQRSHTARTCGSWRTNAVTSFWFTSRMEVSISTSILLCVQLVIAKNCRFGYMPKPMLTSMRWYSGVFEVYSCTSSFHASHQHNCLKNVRALESGVLADDKLIHTKREIIPSSVSMLVRWSLFFVPPGLFYDPGPQKHH